MRFDIYGKRELDVIRDGGRWNVYSVADGKRILLRDVVIPAEVAEGEISIYLDDLFHEAARLGQTIRRIS